MKRIDRIRKSVIGRVLADGHWSEPEKLTAEATGLQLSGHMMRHLLFRTRMRQRRILEQLIDPATSASINDKKPWW